MSEELPDEVSNDKVSSGENVARRTVRRRKCRWITCRGCCVTGINVPGRIMLPSEHFPRTLAAPYLSLLRVVISNSIKSMKSGKKNDFERTPTRKPQIKGDFTTKYIPWKVKFAEHSQLFFSQLNVFRYSLLVGMCLTRNCCQWVSLLAWPVKFAAKLLNVCSPRHP